MYIMGRAVANEMARFPGGPKALAASVTPAAEALRILRWPAEHLDTLGGYLTYHNVLVFTLFLAIYGAVLGARAVRGAEERHSLEEFLATGRSRVAVIRDQAAGFLIVIAVVSLGLGLGVAAAMAGGGAADLGGSLVTMAGGGLCALAGYSLGVLAGQLAGSARAAAGVAALVLTVLYVATNVWDELGLLGLIRFVSPFYYAGFMRALVPGYGFDLPAVAALLVMAAVLLVLAAWAFTRRDYGAPLWARRRARERPPARPSRRQQSLLGAVWRATLLRGRLGLLAWFAAAAALSGLMMVLEPTVIAMWSVFGSFLPGGEGAGATAAETLYVSFSAEIVAPIVAAYVLTQAAGWVADLTQGRVEAVLAAPVSWSRLVWERLLAVTLGAGIVAAGTVAGLLAGAALVDAGLDTAGLLRLVADCLLLGLALGAVAALAVAWLRSGLAVTALAVFVGASFLLSYLAPMFDWPDWVDQLSVFAAFGHPYVEWPSWQGLVVLGLLAVSGAQAAAVVAGHTPKTA